MPIARRRTLQAGLATAASVTLPARPRAAERPIRIGVVPGVAQTGRFFALTPALRLTGRGGGKAEQS